MVDLRCKDIEADAEEDVAADVEEALGGRPSEKVLWHRVVYSLDRERWRRERKRSTSSSRVLSRVREDRHG